MSQQPMMCCIQKMIWYNQLRDIQMPNTSNQIRTEIPVPPTPPQSIQGDSLTTVIIAIAILIKTTIVSAAVLVKVSKS
jgi:hypothetical protein